MNARKNKQRIYSRMGQPGGIVWYNTIVNNAFALTPEELEQQAQRQAKMRADTLAALKEMEAAYTPAPFYNIARKKDGVVVGSCSSLSGAEEMVAKAKAQKKAALYIVA